MAKFYITYPPSINHLFETPEVNVIGGKGKDSTKCCIVCNKELLKEELQLKSKYGMCISCLFKENKQLDTESKL